MRSGIGNDPTDPVYVAVTSGGGGGGGGTSDATAANQTIEIARLTSIRDAFGAAGDTAATSDTGSFSFIAFVKRLLGYQATLATAALKPTAGTNLSGTVTTTSGGFNLPADTNRKPGDVQGQNNGTVAIAFNEFNGTAALNTAGSYTVPPGSQFVITTNRQVNFIAASGTAPVTITGL